MRLGEKHRQIPGRGNILVPEPFFWGENRPGPYSDSAGIGDLKDVKMSNRALVK
jgi:hypothetical protein